MLDFTEEKLPQVLSEGLQRNILFCFVLFKIIRKFDQDETNHKKNLVDRLKTRQLHFELFEYLKKETSFFNRRLLEVRRVKNSGSHHSKSF